MQNDRVIDLPDLDALTEKRGEVRYGLSGLVPATVQGTDGVDIEAVMIDVSAAGLGILTSSFSNRVGDILQLCIEGQASIEMTVRWMRRPSMGDWTGSQTLTRVGLAAQKGQDSLLDRLEPFACIDN